MQDGETVQAEDKLEPAVKISVIIPAFNEQANIARTLDALSLQTLSRDQFEVIVVDNGSVDQTVALARGYEHVFPLRVVIKRGGSIASVRNFGASMAVGEVLAFLDGDCVVKPTWLKDGLELREQSRIWGAHYLVPSDATWVGRLWFNYQAKEKEGPASFIPGSNLFIVRTQFRQLGGFSEVTETSEDVELSQRARRQGLQILAFPHLAVFHGGTPRKLGQFYRQNRWHGMHVMRLFLANLPARDNWQIVAASLYVLLAFWATVVGLPLLMLLGHPWLALLPLGLLLLPSTFLSVAKTVSGGSAVDAPALFVLYSVYFLARAAAVIHRPKRTHRVPITDQG